jgi:putative transcriptional regulator
MKNDVARQRRQRGWTQADLAAALGVSRQTVNAIETGRYDPSLPLAFKLARAFDCSLEELFDDESGTPATTAAS